MKHTVEHHRITNRRIKLQDRSVAIIFVNFILLASCAVLSFPGCADAEELEQPMLNLALDRAWRTDRTWYDGKAEYAIYNATRPIYGTVRQYEAAIITNKQQMDPQTTTKSADWRASGQIEVFKHNVREVIATENYEYKFLTTAFIRTDDLTPYKLTMSSQEDCGATFKHFVMNRGSVDAEAFVYFPDAGPESETYRIPSGFQIHDGLTLVLRSFPFGDPPDGPRKIMALPDQTDTHTTPLRPVTATVTYEGRETLDLPIGEVDAYRLSVKSDSTEEVPGGLESTYWFAADGGPDWLHILVKYEGPFGVTYKLKSNRRWAYWERN